LKVHGGFVLRRRQEAVGQTQGATGKAADGNLDFVVDEKPNDVEQADFIFSKVNF
jgi:hypothetical protein